MGPRLPAYAETAGCRRRFLLGYFGESLPERCGACDTCRSDSAERVEEARGERDVDWPVGLEVRHEAWGDGSIVSEDGDRITVLFDEEGYKTLALEVVGRSGILQPR